MAGHAGFRWWQSRKTRLLDGGVAVAAIQPQPADMMLVAERHRLIAGDVLARDVRRADDLIAKPNSQHRYDSKQCQQQCGNRVGSGTEDLHASVSQKSDIASPPGLGSRANSARD